MAVASRTVKTSPSPSLRAVDHLVFAAPDLESGVDAVRSLLGVEPVAGGRHARWKTRNALVGLGPGTYLEIIAPDGRSATNPPNGRPFGIDGLSAPRLAGWAARASPLEPVVAEARSMGIELGSVLEGSREASDRTVLRWRLTDPAADRDGGTLPFLIDWDESPHPASSLSHPCRLGEIRITHPDPKRIRTFLGPLGSRIRIEGGSGAAEDESEVGNGTSQPAISALLDTPRGLVTLES